jgi:iron(III) transport system substrate-binding protein
MKRITRVSIVLLLAALFSVNFATLPSTAQESKGVLNIYSSRHYGDMEAPFAAFSQATGIEVRVSAGTPQDLLARLRADIQRGGRSVADLFLAIDAGVLSLAASEDLLMAVQSNVLNANIGEAYRDPEGRWFGLSVRTRSLVYNTANVTAEELATLNTYSDLAAPQWKDRICMRPASHIYTISLFSSLLFSLGEAEATEVTKGIVANTPRYINSDTNLIKAVAAGECDLTLTNHYYMARLANGNDEDKAVFGQVAYKWLNQEGDGVFFNVNGAGIIKDAANYDNALLFLEYMSKAENQCGDAACFPGSNYEYPTNAEGVLNATTAGFGERKLNTAYALWQYGEFQAGAVAMLEAAGYGFTEK